MERPCNSGVLGVAVALAVMAIGLGIPPWFLSGSYGDQSIVNCKSNSTCREGPAAGLNKKRLSTVIIRRLTPETRPTRTKRAPSCTCHIDTQEPGHALHHHSTLFPMCTSVKGSVDEEWRWGYFGGVRVQVRWHCTVD